jgi:hypothetical protein
MGQDNNYKLLPPLLDFDSQYIKTPCKAVIDYILIHGFDV